MPKKVHLVKAMVFPVVVYGCESWTIKKAEHRRIDVFKLCIYLNLFLGYDVLWILGTPWHSVITRAFLCDSHPRQTHKSNTLATWYKELTHWKRPWCWERFKAGGEGDDRGWGGWMASLTQWTGVCREALHAAVHGVAKSRTWLSDWNDWLTDDHQILLISEHFSKYMPELNAVPRR